MLRRLTSGAAALALVGMGIGCANGVSVGGSGGSSSADAASSSAGVGGAVGASSSGAGMGHDAGPGPCSMAVDCIALSDVCNVGACVNGSCVRAPANELGSCDDGLFCTENDTCKNGVCVGGAPKFCDTPDACHIGVCDEATDSCTLSAGNDGGQCDDNDPCTLQGTCSAGVCSKGPPVDCSVFDSTCAVGACDPVLGCQPTPVNDGSPCDDGLFCTINDVCTAGKCGGAPNPCAPPGGCYIASCDEVNKSCTAVPGNDGQPCDDGNSCTKGTTCMNGACINGQPDNEGAMCDDGSSCTNMTTCTAGVCGGGIGPTVYFADDFHDSSKGWILGPEWQIGPAMASVGGVFGADPDTDHTNTADNGVAGVVIGGNENPVVHPYYYMESPPFNTANAQGSVILGFYRWLNSDYDPFMHNSIDVWNGQTWVNLWTSGPSPGIQDSPPAGLGWTYIQHDLTAYKNAGMKIRFGYDIGSGGVFTIGSWNIDDVLVASGACP